MLELVRLAKGICNRLAVVLDVGNAIDDRNRLKHSKPPTAVNGARGRSCGSLPKEGEPLI